MLTAIAMNFPSHCFVHHMQYGDNRHRINVLVENGLIYMCFSDKDTRLRITYGFLNELKNQFQQDSATQISSANANQTRNDFAPRLQELMVKSPCCCGPCVLCI